MDSKELKEKIKLRRKKGCRKEHWMTLLYFLPPAICLMGVILVASYSMFLSFALLFFILPMLYTVEKRIRISISGIGSMKFSYKDGYRGFFKEHMNGLFGVIMSLLLGFSLFLLGYLIIFSFLPSIIKIFPESVSTFQQLSEYYNDPNLDAEVFFNYLTEHLSDFSRPLSLISSLILFLPLVSVFFYSIPENLTNHYLATIFLPDIDKNLPASQGRNFAKNVTRAGYWKRLGLFATYNWPYLLIFTLLYGASTFLMCYVRVDNSRLVLLSMMITPTIGCFYGLLLSFFVLYNNYAVIEEYSPAFLETMAPELKMMIYQTYNNPNYRHGEESALRGCYVPNPTTYRDFKASETYDYSKQDVPSQEQPQEREAPDTFVIDLTQKDDEKKDEK